MTRIIAGTAGGRRLATPSGAATRPTADRVREAAFSVISGWAGTAGAPADEALAGLAFLDLYAGSGAIALEAASRGASAVWAVESDRRAAQVIRRNAAETGLRLTLLVKTVEALAAGPASQAFDIVWADPPYAVPTETVDALVAALVHHGWLAAGGLVVVERSTRGRAPVWPTGVEVLADRVYGETALHLATKGNI